MTGWYEFKLFVSHATTLSMDALHLLVGVIAQLLIARLFGLSLADRRPWLAVFGLELFNEASDFAVEQWPDLAHQVGEAAKDVGLTMLIPSLLLLVSRYQPALWAPATSGSESAGEMESRDRAESD